MYMIILIKYQYNCRRSCIVEYNTRLNIMKT